MKYDFVKNQVVESLEKVPVDFRGLYTDTEDGKFKLNTEDATVGDAIKAISGLSTALNASRGETKAARDKQIDLSGLAEFGDGPDSILEAFNTQLEEARAAGNGKVTEDVENAVKAANKAMATAHATELGKHTAVNDALKQQLYSLLVINEATLALTEAKAVRPELVLPFIEKQVQVEEADGQFKVRVMGEQGVRYGGTGSEMTIKEFVREMKDNEANAPLFQSETPSGGGAPPGRPRGTVRKSKENMSSMDKISSGLAKGQFTRGAR